LTHTKYPNTEIHIKDDNIYEYMTTFMLPLHILFLDYIKISPEISCFTKTKNPPPCSHNLLTGYNLCLYNPSYGCQALWLSCS